MKTSHIIILLAIAFALIIVGVSISGTDENGHTNNSMGQHEDASMETTSATDEHGAYETYQTEKLANAADGDVVLFFHAAWCPTCRALDNNIKSHIDDIPVGVTILNVNYDISTALKRKYGITFQHSLVQVDADGNMITKWSGSPTLSEFLTHII